MSELFISALAIYPVKSMRQVAVSEAEIEMGGLKNDRRWMVVDEQGQMITQREQSRLCLIQPRFTDSGISLHTESMPDLAVDRPDGSTRKTVTIWNDRCDVYSAGIEAEAWLTEFLGVTCSLVFFPDDEVVFR